MKRKTYWRVVKVYGNGHHLTKVRKFEHKELAVSLATSMDADADCDSCPYCIGIQPVNNH